jgi:hypothetical protein
MARLVYVGEAEARDIVVPGGWIPVRHGEPFDVDDVLAASLLEQDIFQPAPKPTSKESK